MSLPAAVGPYLITNLPDPTPDDLWINGRPALIGTNVYVLINRRLLDDGSGNAANDGLVVWKGENLGAGPWTALTTITTVADTGWLWVADTYCDGSRLWVLYVAAGGVMTLTVYDPGVNTWTTVTSGLTGLTRVTPDDSVRLGRRSSGDFVAAYTRHDFSGMTPDEVHVHVLSGASFGSALNVTPTHSPAMQNWKLLDAFVDASDVVHVCVVDNSWSSSAGIARYIQISASDSVGAMTVMDDSYAAIWVAATRGAVVGSSIVFPLFSYDSTPNNTVPVFATAGMPSATSWTIAPVSSEYAGFGPQPAGFMALGDFYGAHMRDAFETYPVLPPALLHVNRYDGSASPDTDAVLIDQSATPNSAYYQVAAGVMGTHVGVVVNLLYHPTAGTQQEYYFWRIDLSSPQSGARYYAD